MAGASLLMLLDDMAVVLDDVAVMTKAATKKTVGVLGDDLAVNAEKVSGIVAARELSVVWAVAKGSFVNKLILVPMALLINYVAPWAVLPLLMFGGVFLCLEGIEKVVEYLEKIWHKRFSKNSSEAQLNPDTVSSRIRQIASMTREEMLAHEKKKIKSAVRTDFILSAEIIAITLGVVATSVFLNQVIVLSCMAVAMTAFVYGLVGVIVKIDDVGIWLEKKNSSVAKWVGQILIDMTPYMMKVLTFLGTVAMFLVGGGILSHGIPYTHHYILALESSQKWMQTPIEMGIGFMAGLLALVVVEAFHWLKHRTRTA